MKHNITKQILSTLLALVMIIGLIPASTLTAFAVESPYGIDPGIYPGNSGNITFYVDNDGVLTWTNVPDATSYDVNIWVGGTLFQSLEGLTTPRYELEAKLNEYKRDTGTVKISVGPKGNSEYADGVTFLYSSPYPKLEAPTILYWGGDGMIADWGDVPHADGYTIYLYQSSGGGYNHWTTTESRFDFSIVNVPTLSDGWYFAVQATSTENYRNSEFNESRRRGNVPGKGIITESKTGESGNITFTVDNEGVLTWTPVPEATAYEVIVRVNGSLFQAETITARNYELQAKLNEYKMDSGVVSISISPKGTLERGGGVDYMYSSPYRKLEAPANLTWSGMTAEWEDVIGADGYVIYLYQPGGSGYNHWTTTDSWFDFSGVANPSDGWYFTVQATSTGDYRNSVFNESLRKSVYAPSQTFLIGAYAYNATLTEMDGGGEVYLETAGGNFDWSAEGHIEDVQAGTYVTAKAKAADGYEFVEWRQGTQGDTISPNEAHSFYCTGPQILYAIFRKIGTMFPEGAGSSANNPAMCYSYEEFKYAMESPDIRYVALGNVDDMIAKVEGDGLIPAISVNGIKHLNVIGNATFTVPANNDGYKTICALLHTEQGDTLTVSGAGKLKFRAVANNSYNAVIYNQGGSVIIDDNCTLIGSYNTAVYGKAIWQEYGELRISGGQFFAENALASLALPRAVTAIYVGGGQAWIQGGTFKAESHIDTIDLHYGLDIGQYATVDLSGGTFHGILLPKSSTPIANYMDEETYTPLSDGSRFNPESEYSQEYVESGKVVRIAWMIDHVDIHINAPIAGVDITENYFNIPTSGCEVTMYYPQWYKNGQSVPYGTFEAGASYKVVVWVDVKADYGAEFTNGVTVAINNQSVAVDRKSSHLIAVEYDFGVCPNVVPEVDLTVTAPKEGQNPSYTVGCGSDAYYAVGGSGNYTEYRKWYMSSDNDDWWEINGSHTFMSGYYYKFVVDIRTNNGYEFPLYDNGSSIVPGVSATINGYYANVIKAYDQEPSRYITVEYDFGECSDSIVEKITVENVTAPVAGEKPNYTYSIRGSGYQMNTAKNAYEDIYWKNPPEQWYFIKNGIGWYDLTKNDWVYEHETFIPGHEYQCNVYVVAEDGFEFVMDLYTNPETWATATINGHTAEVEKFGSNLIYAQKVTYTFTCTQPEVTSVILYDLDAPQVGKTPDTAITPAYPEFYEVKSVRWLDEEDGVVNEFEQGRLYTAEITVAAKDYEGTDGCIFANNLTAYIDGTEVAGWSNSVTKNNDNTVTIRYGFRKGASAPEITPYLFITQPQGGMLTVGEALNTTWQTTFIPSKTEIQYWDGETWDQWDVQTPENALDDYDFQYSTDAAYQFRIVTYINETAVATSNTFIITWNQPSHTCSNPQKQNGKSATCAENGWKEYYKCSCGKLYTNSDCSTEITNLESWKIGNGKIAVAHKYNKVTTKATLSKNGSIKNVCKVCGYTSGSVMTIYKVSSITLSQTSYTYKGKVQKPSVIIKDSKGETISSSNYIVTYTSGCKNVGTYKVTIQMKGNYTGTKTLTYKINPVKTSISKLAAGKKKLTAVISKKTTQVTGYEIQYSTSKKFKNSKKKTVSSYKKASVALTGLKAKTTYYVRVRTYRTVKGKKYYSGWSKIKSAKTK